jgi:hypothetical protein
MPIIAQFPLGCKQQVFYFRIFANWPAFAVVFWDFIYGQIVLYWGKNLREVDFYAG